MEFGNIPAFLRSLVGTILEVKRGWFTMVVDIEFISNSSSAMTHLATILCKPQKTIWFSSPFSLRNRSINIGVSFDHGRHMVEEFLKLVSSLCSGGNFPFFFQPERESLFRFSKTDGVSPSMEEFAHKICINVNSGILSVHRRWAKEYSFSGHLQPAHISNPGDFFDRGEGRCRIWLGIH